MSFGAFGQSSSLLFASQPSPFNSSQPLFSSQPQELGTQGAKWQVSQIHDGSSTDPGKYHSISAMEPFRAHSVEELRFQDYSRGDKGGQATSGFGQNAPFATSQQSTSAFGSTPFAAQSSPFAQPQSSAFGASFQSSSAFGAPSAFGSTPFGGSQPSFGASQPTFGASQSAFGASQPLFGASQPTFGASQSAFGAPQPAFGVSQPAFGASQPAFGVSQSAFGASQPAFGASQPVFGASQPAFGGGSQPSFGAPAFSASSAAFGASSGSLFGSSMARPAGGLFGSSQPAGGLFGSSQPQSAPSLFGASSSALGTSGAFAGGFGTSQPASTPSLFGGGATGAGLFGNTGSGLFGNTGSTFGNTGAGLFGNTSGGFGTTGGLFGSTPSLGFGASSGGLFGGSGSGLFGGSGGSLFGGSSGGLFGSSSGSLFGQGGLSGGFGAAQPAAQQQPQGPLEASLTVNPFGASKLFTGLAQSGNAGVGASVVGGSRPVSVVVGSTKPYRRTRASELMARSVMRRRAGGGGWFMSSPMKPWGEGGGVFDAGGVLGRTEEQRRRAANLKRLVVEPLADDPVLTAPARFGEKVLTSNRAEEESRDAQADEARQENTGDMEGDDNAGLVDETGQGPTQAQSDREGGGTGMEETVDMAAADESPGRYVPYKEFYRNQFSATKRRPSSIGDRSQLETRAEAPNVPKCTTADIYTKPSLEEMRSMSNEELSRVEDLTIGRDGMGEITWLEPTDVRGMDFDRIVEIKPKEVSIYPRDEDLPPAGMGLNKRARVKLFGISRVDRASGVAKTDAGTAAKMVAKLKAHCEREGLTFLGYDIKTGVWSFEASNF